MPILLGTHRTICFSALGFPLLADRHDLNHFKVRFKKKNLICVSV
jgi:hypothetical protein